MKETKEVVTALAAVVVRVVKSLRDDGKLSWTEGLGFVAEFSKIKDAISGVHLVPGEVLDMNAEDNRELRDTIFKGLEEAGITERTADIVSWVIEWITSTVRLAVRIKNAPPSAVAV